METRSKLPGTVWRINSPTLRRRRAVVGVGATEILLAVAETISIGVAGGIRSVGITHPVLLLPLQRNAVAVIVKETEGKAGLVVAGVDLGITSAGIEHHIVTLVTAGKGAGRHSEGDIRACAGREAANLLDRILVAVSQTGPEAKIGDGTWRGDPRIHTRADIEGAIASNVRPR